MQCVVTNGKDKIVDSGEPADNEKSQEKTRLEICLRINVATSQIAWCSLFPQ